jgi:hypothetical protein
MKQLAEAFKNELETPETAGFQSVEIGLNPPNLGIVSLYSLFMKKLICEWCEWNNVILLRIYFSNLNSIFMTLCER